MPVYNAESTVGRAVSSILNQTFTNFEFLILNDGSTDNTLQVLKKFNDKRIKIVSQKNHGIAFSLNKLLLLAKSDLIARQDADDVSLRTRLEKQYIFMQANPNIVPNGPNQSPTGPSFQ